jgi:hypothetical protein
MTIPADNSNCGEFAAIKPKGQKHIPAPTGQSLRQFTPLILIAANSPQLKPTRKKA